LVAASFNSFAQTCAVSTTAPAGFTTVSTIANTGSSSFTWTGTTTPGTIQATSTSVKTPILYYNSSQTAVTVAYDLLSTANGNGATTTINSYSIQLITGTSSVQCSGGSFSISNTTATTYYFTISGVSLPASNNFQVAVTFNLSNGQKDVATSNFRSNAALAAAGATLPVKFSGLDARMANNTVSLNWKVGTENNVNGYEIEKSADGNNYSKIGFVNAIGQSDYAFVDSKPGSISYYRIKSVDVNGRYTYSTVALVKAGKSIIVLKAFPSPFAKSLSIQHPTAIGSSLITISSEDGRTVKSIVPVAGSQQTDIDLSTAKAGMYLIRFSDGNGGNETLKVLKQQ